MRRINREVLPVRPKASVVTLTSCSVSPLWRLSPGWGRAQQTVARSGWTWISSTRPARKSLEPVEMTVYCTKTVNDWGRNLPDPKDCIVEYEVSPPGE